MARSCPSCGKSVDDDAAFCSSCGAAVPPADTPPAPPPGAGTPPPIPPPAPTDAPPPAGGASRRPLIVVIVVLAVVVVAALAVAAYFLFVRDNGDSGNATNPSPTASVSPSPSPSASGTPMSVIVVASGPKEDALTVIGFMGEKATLVPGDGKQLTDLQWSPDGRRVAYLKHDSYSSWETTLMTLDVAAGQATAVSFGDMAPQMIYGFAWVSPTELVAAAYPTVPEVIKSNGTLYRCDVAANTAEPLKDSSGKPLSGQQPSASADGAKLTFVSFTPKGSSGVATETLELLDVASGQVSKVASAENEVRIEGYNFNAPLLSPDGTQIFTEHTGSDPGFEVTIFNTDGSTVATLPGLSWPTGAAWDPTGSGRVIFGSTVPEGDEFSGPAPPKKPVLIRVWDPRAAGTGEFVVVHAQKRGPLHNFAWSPDGESVVYTTWSFRRDTPGDDLFFMKSGGGRAVLAMKDAGFPARAMAVVPQLPAYTSPTPIPPAY